jgi:septum formation protein
MEQPHLHLASSSPRRREILTVLGLSFSYKGVDIDESRGGVEPVTEMVMRLAREKALAADNDQFEALPVLAADTIVVLGNRVFGKPSGEEDALSMLAALSGSVHKVFTAVALLVGGRVSTAMSETEVRFRDIGRDEARAYWQSGEPAGKAGAYAIQGLGGIFAESLHGSYSGVVGLPVFETAQLLRIGGIDVLPQTN